MVPKRILFCEWCRKSFAKPHGKGPDPRYCKASHRQRAYEKRRIDSLMEKIKVLS